MLHGDDVRDQPAQRRVGPGLRGDYVLGTYGTGAIMAVPGRRTDHAFAVAYALPIVHTTEVPDGFVAVPTTVTA